MTFDEAIEYAKQYRKDGYDDWRIPSLHEWFTILSYKNNKIDLSMVKLNASSYWSSTTNTSHQDYAWYVYLGYGYVSSTNKSSSFCIKCVRGGQYDSFGLLITRNLNEDEELFTIKDGIVIDNRTGLEWER